MKLFDILFGRAIDRRIAVYQNDLIAKHCEEVQNVYTIMMVFTGQCAAGGMITIITFRRCLR